MLVEKVTRLTHVYKTGIKYKARVVTGGNRPFSSVMVYVASCFILLLKASICHVTRFDTQKIAFTLHCTKRRKNCATDRLQCVFVSLHVYSIILADPTEVHGNSHKEHDNAVSLFFLLASGNRTCGGKRKVGTQHVV